MADDEFGEDNSAGVALLNAGEQFSVKYQELTSVAQK